MKRISKIKFKLMAIWLVALAVFTFSRSSAQYAAVRQAGGSLALQAVKGEKPRNIVFILVDDHRFDAMGFLNTQPFIKTPNLDKMAKGGAYLKNAFVTTSLCSPSRASILTGLYAHKHKVVDNVNPVSSEIVFYSQYLQQVGYQTAMIGKWHIGGDHDDPQRGFDYWVSFKGQGNYLPGANGLNVNGQKVPQKGYITDELTDYALDFIRGRKKEKPFMLYLSHKGVHSQFNPADRHKGKAEGFSFKPPANMEASLHKNAPMWLQNQRNSFHGIDFPYHGNLDIEQYYKRYAETLMGVDESVGTIMDFLKQQGLLESTLIVYMGDNGFQFGEHGLIDKRVAYEASMRVPMLAYCPQIIKAGTVIEEVVANIDIAPTFLEAAGLEAPEYVDGQSFLPMLKGLKPAAWRTGLLYEYFWERNYPHTPTMHAVRGDRYKYIRYTGLWDTDELYDIQSDPLELNNLIHDPEHKALSRKLNKELFAILDKTGGLYIPLLPDNNRQNNMRSESGAKAASFPDYLIKKNSGIKK